MATNKYIDFNLPQDAYVTFDALTLKDFIVNRLSNDETFTDQVYEGSNLSSIIEIIAYSYHVLMFYLNTTASESTFSQATLYENMNKIVNLVGYKPTGKVTSTCSINAVADSALPVDSYLIRKYSYFLVDDMQYTFPMDYSFSKATTSEESIEALNENVILYQGTVEQYPVYTAAGEEFETFPVVVNNVVDSVNEKFISHGSISVYVKEKQSGLYYQYTETGSLYLSKSFDRSYDLRLNENGNYEVKFGNNVFGRQLETGDEVVVFYILSDNVVGVISKGAINGNKLFTYSTSLFDTIYGDTQTISEATLITNTNSALITFSNPINSTVIGDSESVDTIRKNTSKHVASNLRLATAKDYTAFLEKNLNNLIQSVYVASNQEFLSQYIDYFYRISVDPNKVNRVLLNQVNFADSCDFNNVNIFCVPKFTQGVDDTIPDYLTTAFKNLIVDLTKEYKMVGAEVVPRDPVFTTFKLGISNKTQLDTGIPNNCKLVLVRETNNKIQKEILKSRVVDLIKDFFLPANNTLGETIAISELASRILSVVGIKNIYTQNTAENLRFEGVSFIGWNPIYPADDITMINQDTTLPFFKFPYLNYPATISNYIDVIDE